MLLTKQFEREPVIGQAKCPPSSRLVHVSLCSPYLICRTDLVHFMDPFLSFNSMITKCRKQNVLCGRHWFLSSFAIRQNRLLVSKAPNCFRFYNDRLLLFTRSSKDVRQSGLIGIREDLDSNHSSNTERKESLSGWFLSL